MKSKKIINLISDIDENLLNLIDNSEDESFDLFDIGQEFGNVIKNYTIKDKDGFNIDDFIKGIKDGYSGK